MDLKLGFQMAKLFKNSKYKSPINIPILTAWYFIIVGGLSLCYLINSDRNKSLEFNIKKDTDYLNKIGDLIKNEHQNVLIYLKDPSHNNWLNNPYNPCVRLHTLVKLTHLNYYRFKYNNFDIKCQIPEYPSKYTINFYDGPLENKKVSEKSDLSHDPNTPYLVYSDFNQDYKIEIGQTKTIPFSIESIFDSESIYFKSLITSLIVTLGSYLLLIMLVVLLIEIITLKAIRKKINIELDPWIKVALLFSEKVRILQNGWSTMFTNNSLEQIEEYKKKRDLFRTNIPSRYEQDIYLGKILLPYRINCVVIIMDINGFTESEKDGEVYRNIVVIVNKLMWNFNNIYQGGFENTEGDLAISIYEGKHKYERAVNFARDIANEFSKEKIIIDGKERKLTFKIAIKSSDLELYWRSDKKLDLKGIDRIKISSMLKSFTNEDKAITQIVVERADKDKFNNLLDFSDNNTGTTEYIKTSKIVSLASLYPTDFEYVQFFLKNDDLIYTLNKIVTQNSCKIVTRIIELIADTKNVDSTWDLIDKIKITIDWLKEKSISDESWIKPYTALISISGNLIGEDKNLENALVEFLITKIDIKNDRVTAAIAEVFNEINRSDLVINNIKNVCKNKKTTISNRLNGEIIYAEAKLKLSNKILKSLFKLIKNKNDLGTGIYYSHKIFSYYKIVGPSALLVMKYYYKCIQELNKINTSDLDPRMQNILIQISDLHNHISGADESKLI